MPKPNPFPSGAISVSDQHLLDISAGMDWDMEDANNVRFLAVRGTIWVGDCHTTYNFTLVEYQLYIDEVPWLIFSTLADALEKEFEPNFWGTVNYSRKERWGFLEPPWDGKAYGVAPPYTKMRLSIFNNVAHTMRVVQPFVWNHTHLKVHPNGAMVFHEEKRLAFLLPLIVEAHELLPPKPLFWVNDDNTIPLWRTTLWLHDETIQWLAETGESYPQELRDEIQPRIAQLKPPQHAKRTQPPPPPLPTRWTERSAAKQPVQTLQTATPPDPKSTQSTPQQVADRERQYMELQSIIAQANQRTLASRPADVKQIQKPANLQPQVNKTQTTRQPPHRPIPVRAWGQKLRLHHKAVRQLKSVHNHSLTKDQAHHRSYPRISRKRIPRVPVCYPPTSTPQLTAKMTNSSSLQSSPQATTTHQQKNRRLQIHPMHRQRLRQLTPLVLAALSLPAIPCKMLTLPQRTSRLYRTWRRQPVKEWSSIKRGSSVLASN